MLATENAITASASVLWRVGRLPGMHTTVRDSFNSTGALLGPLRVAGAVGDDDRDVDQHHVALTPPADTRGSACVISHAAPHTSAGRWRARWQQLLSSTHHNLWVGFAKGMARGEEHDRELAVHDVRARRAEPPRTHNATRKWHVGGG